MSQNLSLVAERIAADESDPFVIDVRRLETADDMFAAVRSVAVATEQAETRHTERTIRAKTSVGRALVWGYTAVCDFAGVAANKRTAIDALTIGKIGPVLGINKANAVELTGYALETLTACVELGRGDDHDHAEARRALIARDENITERTLRTAINTQLHPDVVSNRAAGAAKAQAAAVAAVTGKAAKTVAATGADAKVVAAVTKRVATSALTPAQIAALSDEQIAATIWALAAVRDARKAGKAQAPKAPKAPAKPKAKAPAKA